MPDPARSARSQPLAPGTAAPAFTLPVTPDQDISLSDFRGRPVVLVFYPADWSPVCGDELALFNEVRDDLQRHDAQLLAISTDGVWCHLAFTRDRRLRFPLLSDFEPKGEVARRYGVYWPKQGTSHRALFVVDREGRIAWSHQSPDGVNPGVDGVLDALERLPRLPAPPPESHP
jgi:peroxiredoxin